MLKALTIRNFRSIVDAELSFGKINLFIGPNGGGKSNLLEAIGIASAALGRSIEPIDLDIKGVRLSLPRLFKSTFKGRKIPKGFNIVAKTERTVYKVRLLAGEGSTALHFSHESLMENGQKVLGRAPRGPRIHMPKLGADIMATVVSPGSTRGVFDTYRNAAILSDEAQTELDQLGSYVIYTPQSAILRGTASDPRILEPLGLTGGRLAVALAELLEYRRKKATEVEWERVQHCLSVVWKAGWPDTVRAGAPQPDIVPPQVPTLPKVLYFRDRFMRTNRAWLSAFDASEGTLYLLFIAILLAHPGSPRVFALDNVDGTLNPGLVRRLVEHIVEVVTSEESEVRQVFLTSHNPTALDALDLFNDDHCVYVVLRDEKTGRTEFKRVRPPEGMSREEWIKYRDGRNTSVLWLEGLIVGALS